MMAVSLNHESLSPSVVPKRKIYPVPPTKHWQSTAADPLQEPADRSGCFPEILRALSKMIRRPQGMTPIIAEK
jgi:hypothetical protein